MSNRDYCMLKQDVSDLTKEETQKAMARIIYDLHDGDSSTLATFHLMRIADALEVIATNLDSGFVAMSDRER